jgi:hypothetical protein
VAGQSTTSKKGVAEQFETLSRVKNIGKFEDRLIERGGCGNLVLKILAVLMLVKEEATRITEQHPKP